MLSGTKLVSSSGRSSPVGANQLGANHRDGITKTRGFFPSRTRSESHSAGKAAGPGHKGREDAKAKPQIRIATARAAFTMTHEFLQRLVGMCLTSSPTAVAEQSGLESAQHFTASSRARGNHTSELQLFPCRALTPQVTTAAMWHPTTRPPSGVKQNCSKSSASCMSCTRAERVFRKSVIELMAQR